MTQELAVNTAAANDIAPVIEYLGSIEEKRIAARWLAAEPLVAQIWPQDRWRLRNDFNAYGAEAHANLLEREMQQGFRRYLADKGIRDAVEYAALIGEMQYVGFEAQLRSVFGDDRARANQGWRIRVVSYPALGITVMGVASHYQGSQAQARIGQMSAILRSKALGALRDTHDRAALYRSPGAEDWDGRGLMDEPVLSVGKLDISDFDEGRGAKLRFVRNTTSKKELASFFLLRSIQTSDLVSEDLEELAAIGEELGRPSP